MEIEQKYLLADMQAAEGHRVKITFKADRQTVEFQLNHVMQSHDSKRRGRWIAMVDNGICQTFDILEEIRDVELAKAPYRNWKHINHVTCDLTRAALMYSNRPSVVAKLQTMFPECFQVEPPIPILWEQIQDEEIKIIRRMGNCNELYARQSALFNFMEAVNFFNIPTVLKWEYDKGGYFPEELWGQLVGKKIEQPAYIVYKGIRCIPAHLCCHFLFREGRPTKVFDKWDLRQMPLVYLVAADMIDFGNKK